MTLKVLALLGSSSDLPATEDGVAILKRFKVPHAVRIASAHRSPEMLAALMREFESQGGQVYIGVAGMSAHLAGVIASMTLKPVLAVPMARPETAGLDALLSMGQMPKGVPVSTMPFGKAGFANASLTAIQILALNDARLAALLSEDRVKMAQAVADDDVKHRQEFRG